MELTNTNKNNKLETNQKYYIETYGCQMNVYDSELVAGMLKECGFSQTSDLNKADAVFLNTCAIREKAEDTIHNRLNNLQYLKRKNPSIVLGVLGCMAQNLQDKLLESRPYVDVILGPDSYRRLPEIIRNRQHKVNFSLSQYSGNNRPNQTKQNRQS